MTISDTFHPHYLPLNDNALNQDVRQVAMLAEGLFNAAGNRGIATPVCHCVSDG